MQIIVTNVFWKMAAIEDGYIPGSIQMKGEFILDWLILFGRCQLSSRCKTGWKFNKMFHPPHIGQNY